MYKPNTHKHTNTNQQAVVTGTPFNTVDPAEMAVENKVGQLVNGLYISGWMGVMTGSIADSMDKMIDSNNNRTISQPNRLSLASGAGGHVGLRARHGRLQHQGPYVHTVYTWYVYHTIHN